MANNNDEKDFFQRELEKKQEELQRQQRVAQETTNLNNANADTTYNSHPTYEKAKTPKWFIIMIVAILMVVIFFLGYVCFQLVNPQIALLNQVWQVAKQYYLTDVDDDLLLAAAANGLLGSLDQYSKFLTPLEYYELLNPPIEDGDDVFGIMTYPQESGIPNGRLIYSVAMQTRAYFTGLMAYDLITNIDNVVINGNTTDEEFTNLVRNATTITIKRCKNDDVGMIELSNMGLWNKLTLTVDKTDRLVVPTFVEYFIDNNNTNMPAPILQYLNINEATYTDKKVAYARIAEFSGAGESKIVNNEYVYEYSADKDFAEFMTKFATKFPNKDARLILDVCNNPGGNNYIIVNIARYLAYDSGNPDVTISHLTTRNMGSEEYTVRSLYGDYFDVNATTKQIVILTNGHSASASEMLTGCIIDKTGNIATSVGYGTAEQIGTQTYGKGISQTVVPIKNEKITYNGKQVDSSYAVYITFAKFYTPKSNYCNQDDPTTKARMGFVNPDSNFVIDNRMAKMAKALNVLEA